MCVFKMLKVQILLLASLFLFSSCGFLSIGSETQVAITSKTAPATTTTNTSEEHIDKRTGACEGVKISALDDQKEQIAEQNGSALFNVLEVTEDRIGIETDDSKLPHQVNLFLTACFRNARKKDSPPPPGSYTIKYEIFNKEANQLEPREEPTSTDITGCMTWREKYPHKFVTKPFWVYLKREIIGKGAFAGQVILPTAVNFWLKGEDKTNFPAVIDLRHPYDKKNAHILKKHLIAKQGVKCLSDKKSSAGQPQLWAPKIFIQFRQNPKPLKKNMPLDDIKDEFETLCETDDLNEKCTSRILTMDLNIPLILQTRTTEDNPSTMAINGGKYEITAQLLAELPQGQGLFYRVHKQKLHEEQITMKGNVAAPETSALTPQFELKIPYSNLKTDHQLILTIRAKNGLPFREFQGVYTIKNPVLGVKLEVTPDDIYNTVNGVETIKPEEKSKIESIQYVHNYAKDQIPADITNEEERKKKLKTILDNMAARAPHMSVTIKNINFANTKNDTHCPTNETVVRRRVEYKGTACLTDLFIPTQETNFRIFREDVKKTKNDNLMRRKIKQVFEKKQDANLKELFRKEKEPFRTEADGCITWRDTIDHKNFDRQIYFPRKMYFVSEDQNLYGTALIAISPWHNQFQFFQDISQIHVGHIRTEPSGVENPKLVMPLFRSMNFAPSAVIDRFLNLNIKYNLRFLFQPIITRPDSLAWGKLPRSREFIRDGYYLVRVVITRDPRETGGVSSAEAEEPDEQKRRVTVFNYLKKLNLNNLEYIHHTDTVVRVAGNFVNMYIPLKFTTEQLLYMASRNLVIFQMVPADPGKYIYKNTDKDGVLQGKGPCQVDTKAMWANKQWQPYTDHDLVTLPYAAPINAQNWINWNILQEVCDMVEDGSMACLNTDALIDSSQKGKKHRLFAMHPAVEQSIKNEQNKNQKPSTTPAFKQTGSSKRTVENTTPGTCKTKDKDCTRVAVSTLTSAACQAKTNELELAYRRRTSIDSDEKKQRPKNWSADMSTTADVTEPGSCPQGDATCELLQDEHNASGLHGNVPEYSIKQFYEKKFVNPEDTRIGRHGCLITDSELLQVLIEEEKLWETGEDLDDKDLQALIDKAKEEVKQQRQQQKQPALLKEGPFDPVENINTLSQNFAKTNALRLVDLADDNALGNFLSDINKQTELIKYYAENASLPSSPNQTSTNSTFRIMEALLKDIYHPHKDRDQFLTLWGEINKTCPKEYTHGDVMAFYHQCAIKLVRDHLTHQITEYRAIDLLRLLDRAEQDYSPNEEESLNAHLYNKMKQRLESQVDHYHIGGFHLLWNQSNEHCHTELDTSSSDTKTPLSEAHHECLIASFQEGLREQIEITGPLPEGEHLTEKYNKMKYVQDILDERLRIESAKADKNFLYQKQVLLDTGTISDNQLFHIIDNGIQNPKNSDILQGSFAHALCGFWFESFLPQWLQPEQMQTAFTDHIQKLGYNTLLDNHLFFQNKTDSDLTEYTLLSDLFDLIPGAGSLSQCRTSYTKCVLGDYCSIGNKNQRQQSFCNFREDTSIPFNMSGDTSCRYFVLRKCQPVSMSEFCNIEAQKIKSEKLCKKHFNIYCEKNSEDSICSSYNGRCLENYLTCAKQQNSDEENPLSKTFLDTRADFVNFLHYDTAIHDHLTYGYLNKLPSFPDNWMNSIIAANKTYQHPLQTCLHNPSAFFNFENKLIVGDTKKSEGSIRFKKGLNQHFQLSGNFAVGSYLNWNAESRFATGVRVGPSSRAIPGLAEGKSKGFLVLLSRFFFNLFTATVSSDMSSSQGRGRARGMQNQLSNSASLIVSESEIEIDLTHFKKCLVIKPLPNAFNALYRKPVKWFGIKVSSQDGLTSQYDEEKVWPNSFRGKDFKKIALSRPGLMLCNSILEANDSPEDSTITEKYYYISQVTGAQEIAELLNPFDIRNRPFTMVGRGRNEFMKIFHLLRQIIEGGEFEGETKHLTKMPADLMRYYPKPVEHFVGLSLTRRAFRDTGFHPGIYTYESWWDERDFATHKLDTQDNIFHETFKWLRKHYSFKPPALNNTAVPVKADDQ